MDRSGREGVQLRDRATCERKRAQSKIQGLAQYEELVEGRGGIRDDGSRWGGVDGFQQRGKKFEIRI